MKAAEVAELVEDRATRERNIRRTSREKRNTSSNRMDTERTRKYIVREDSGEDNH